MTAKIDRDIEMLKNWGNTLRMPHSEHLKDGIFQLRTQLGNNRRNQRRQMKLKKLKNIVMIILKGEENNVDF